MAYVKDNNGNVFPYWGAFAYGEFNKNNPVVYRYPQKKGIQWHRDIVPALKRALKKYFGLKPNGYWSVDSLMVKAEEMDSFYNSTKIPRLLYNDILGEFEIDEAKNES